jgi:hypothetical protein
LWILLSRIDFASLIALASDLIQPEFWAWQDSSLKHLLNCLSPPNFNSWQSRTPKQGRSLGDFHAVNDFSYTVRMWDGEYAVGLQHLKSYDYLSAECEQIQSLSNACGGLRLRLAWIYSDSLFGDS